MSPREINEFLRIILKRGMRFDTQGSGSIIHKHNEVDPSAPKPPLKFDLCTPDLRPTGRMQQGDIETMGKLLWQYAQQNKVDVPAAAGVPRVGSAIAEAFQKAAQQDGVLLPLISLTKESLPDGMRRIGPPTDTTPYPPGQKILPMDDVAHWGFSKLETIERLQEAGYLVSDLLVFLDYASGAKEALAQKGVALHSVATVAQVLAFAEQENLIQVRDLRIIREYLEHEQN